MISNSEQIEEIKRMIEKDCGISFPEVDVKYSDNVDNAFCIERVHISPRCSERHKKEFFKKRTCELRREGLRESEISQIDPLKYAIFIPRGYSNDAIKLCATEWEELGHVAAYALDVNDPTLNESIALAYRIKGLLEGAKKGFLQKEQAIRAIESYIKAIKYEPLNAGIFLKLKKMGLNVPEEYTTQRHFDALSSIKKFNPSLNFRDFELDELLRMLNESINYAIRVSQYGFADDEEETEDLLTRIMKRLFRRRFRDSRIENANSYFIRHS